jgi:hypothetical protein
LERYAITSAPLFSLSRELEFCAVKPIEFHGTAPGKIIVKLQILGNCVAQMVREICSLGHNESVFFVGPEQDSCLVLTVLSLVTWRPVDVGLENII